MSLSKEEVREQLIRLFHETDGNTVTGEDALPGCEGLIIYEQPIFGFASASDPLFERFHDKSVIGEPYRDPGQWLSDAMTVISFFLPFTEDVRKANCKDREITANEWLHGRIEGQQFLNTYTEKCRDWFTDRGLNACAPAVDGRFSKTMRPFQKGDPSRLGLHFASAWSERHAAYAAGLGTFSLTRGLISEKGVAGRYGSLIISEFIEPDLRSYTGIYDNCIRCGACIKRCPANAISLKRGKDQLRCSTWVLSSKKKYAPRYGCGKCQVGVPCETRNPSKGKNNA